MPRVAVSNLAYAHPGGELLFSEVFFRLAPGTHAALVGTNGVGKSTLMRILAGELTTDEGEPAVGAARLHGAGSRCRRTGVLAVSRDRAFLRGMDRFLMVLHDGAVLALPDWDSARRAISEPGRAAEVRLAKILSERPGPARPPTIA